MLLKSYQAEIAIQFEAEGMYPKGFVIGGTCGKGTVVAIEDVGEAVIIRRSEGYSDLWLRCGGTGELLHKGDGARPVVAPIEAALTPGGPMPEAKKAVGRPPKEPKAPAHG